MDRLRFRAGALLAISLLAWIGGCASVDLATSWKDPEFTAAPFRKVLVLGVARSDTNRRVFEDKFSQSLKAAGVEAMPSYTLIPENGAIANDRIQQAVEKAGADAVMVTQLRRVEKRVDVSPGYIGPSYRMGFYGYYGMAWTATPPIINQYDVLTLETTLWDTKTQKVVWSGTTKAVEPKDVPTLTGELSKVLIAKMRADKAL